MRNLLDTVKLLCYDQLPHAKKNCKKCVYRMMNNCGECIFTTNYNCDLRMSKKMQKKQLIVIGCTLKPNFLTSLSIILVQRNPFVVSQTQCISLHWAHSSWSESRSGRHSEVLLCLVIKLKVHVIRCFILS